MIDLADAAAQVRAHFPRSSNSHELWTPWGNVVGLGKKIAKGIPDWAYGMQSRFYNEHFDHGAFFRETEKTLMLTGMPYVECRKPTKEVLTGLDRNANGTMENFHGITAFRLPWSFYSSGASLVIVPGLVCTGHHLHRGHKVSLVFQIRDTEWFRMLDRLVQ